MKPTGKELVDYIKSKFTWIDISYLELVVKTHIERNDVTKEELPAIIEDYILFMDNCFTVSPNLKIQKAFEILGETIAYSKGIDKAFEVIITKPK